jgi:glycosyl hydrolase family 113
LTPHRKQNRANQRPIFVGFVVIGLFAVLWDGFGVLPLARFDPSGPGNQPVETQKIAGLTLDARRPPSEEAFDDIQAMGTSHVAVIPYAWVRGTSIQFNSGGRWFSESGNGIRALAPVLAARGIALIIKPQLWIRGGGFAGNLTFPSEADWFDWEDGYRAYALHYAELAEEVKADIFVVGSELTRSALDRPSFWRSLIADVRSRFSGRLVYAANWYAEVDSVSFWDDLDLIGVQGYYPLSTEPDPSADALAEGWTRPTLALKRLASQWDKQVLFTEIGYRSAGGAAAQPWLWTPRTPTEAPDFALQHRLFQAFFSGPWSERWVEGAVVWKWYGEPRGGARHAVDFTPQGKPAETAIRQAFRNAEQSNR